MNPSKRKGNSFEREVVNQSRSIGLTAERAYASNGKSLGYSEEVDVVINGIPIQCKRRKSIASYLQIPEGAEAVLIRQDRGETFIILRFDAWLSSLTE